MGFWNKKVVKKDTGGKKKKPSDKENPFSAGDLINKIKAKKRKRKKTIDEIFGK